MSSRLKLFLVGAALSIPINWVINIQADFHFSRPSLGSLLSAVLCFVVELAVWEVYEKIHGFNLHKVRHEKFETGSERV